DYIREILATNIAGMMYMVRGFATRLARLDAAPDALRGVVINVSSVTAADGGMGSGYCISKGAVDTAGLSLARELSPWGIRVVTIAPGGIDTELYRAGATEGTHAMMKALVPSLRRTGRPDEFARLALHICENDYLNGCNIRLDGGLRSPFSADVGGGVEAV
ncbi:MAG: SDR family oxidoreductase, partial [Sphingomonadales bacterium]